jgi:uncharacterized Zn-binding protein involved in type VI secretion
MGQPVARQGDTTATGDPIVGGSVPTVHIAGKPAAVVGDVVSGAALVGSVPVGSRTIYVGGRPLVRAGDTASGANPATGAPVTSPIAPGQGTVTGG